MDIAPGVAVALAKASVRVDGEANPMDLLMSVTLVYEDGAWKIASIMKQSKMHDMPVTHEVKEVNNGGFKALLTLIIGAVLGFFGCKMLHKRNNITPTTTV